MIEKRVYEIMRASFPADFDEPEKLKEAVTARTAGKGNTGLSARRFPAHCQSGPLGLRSESGMLRKGLSGLQLAQTRVAARPYLFPFFFPLFLAFVPAEAAFACCCASIAWRCAFSCAIRCCRILSFGIISPILSMSDLRELTSGLANSPSSPLSST